MTARRAPFSSPNGEHYTISANQLGHAPNQLISEALIKLPRYKFRSNGSPVQVNIGALERRSKTSFQITRLNRRQPSDVVY